MAITIVLMPVLVHLLLLLRLLLLLLLLLLVAVLVLVSVYLSSKWNNRCNCNNVKAKQKCYLPLCPKIKYTAKQPNNPTTQQPNNQNSQNPAPEVELARELEHV